MHPSACQRGLSLAELLATIAIIGIVATLAVPSLRAPLEQSDTLAAQTIGDAVRFARDQARHSGRLYGVDVDVANQTLTVFRISDTGRVEYDVAHPLTKQPYAVEFGSGFYRDVKLMGLTANWSGGCNTGALLAIDPRGFTRCADPLSVYGVGQIEYSHLGVRHAVEVHQYSGRIEAL